MSAGTNSNPKLGEVVIKVLIKQVVPLGNTQGPERVRRFAVEHVFAGLGTAAPDLSEERGILALQIVVGDVVGRALVEHADRADVVGPGIGLGADAGA